MSPNTAASIKARLLNQTRESGEEFELTLTRFAAERLLYRLGASSARAHCILKGASLLAVWLQDPYRATRDIDVLGSGPADDAAVRALIQAICAVECPEDAVRFDLSELSITTIRAAEEYAGKRARFRAYLGNARIQIQLDVGFGDAVAMEAEEIEYPTMLDTLPAPKLRAYPREATVAEKFEAMVKLGTQNSRMKDFHDVWALAGAFHFDGPTLQRTIAACFEGRGTHWPHEVPHALSPAFYQDRTLATRWRNYLAAGAVHVPPPAQFESIGEQVIRFLGPVRLSIAEGAAFEFAWNPGSSWESK